MPRNKLDLYWKHKKIDSRDKCRGRILKLLIFGRLRSCKIDDGPETIEKCEVLSEKYQKYSHLI